MSMIWFSDRFSFLISDINGIPDLNFRKPKLPRFVHLKNVLSLK